MICLGMDVLKITIHIKIMMKLSLIAIPIPESNILALEKQRVIGEPNLGIFVELIAVRLLEISGCLRYRGGSEALLVVCDACFLHSYTITDRLGLVNSLIVILAEQPGPMITYQSISLDVDYLSPVFYPLVSYSEGKEGIVYVCVGMVHWVEPRLHYLVVGSVLRRQVYSSTCHK
jgi:hypothetical protein